MTATGSPPAPAAPLPPGTVAGRGLRYLLAAFIGGVIFLCGMLMLYAFGRLPFATFLTCSIAAVLPVPIYGSLILWLDRHEKEPGILLLAAFLWGAGVATFFAIILNGIGENVLKTLFGPQWGLALTPSLVAPIVEETGKGAALLLMFFLARHEFNNVVDGIIYGALVGLGFAMTENVLYFAGIYREGGLLGVGVLFFIRVILGGLNHSLFTGCTGAGLGFSREVRSRVLKVLLPIVGYLFGIFFHFVWNGSATLLGVGALNNLHWAVVLFVVLPGMTAVLALPGLFLLLLLAYFGWRREVRVIHEQLRDEVDHGTVTPAEYAVLVSARERWRRLWRTLTQQGFSPWYALRQLYELQVDLAFRKFHTSRGDRLLEYQRVYAEDAYRARIAQVRARLNAMGVATA